MKFNPVSNKKLYIQIYNQILSEIQLGSFKVGDKLPSERELCEQFGVSRAPVRQALSALEMNGVIYSRQGEGVFVKNTTITTEGTLSMKSASPEDIVEARMHIEPLIIHFAALRATDQEIEELKQTIKKWKKKHGRVYMFLKPTNNYIWALQERHITIYLLPLCLLLRML